MATTARSRLFGLALLDRETAGPGLLIPGCRSIHTFGMRFALEVRFLDHRGSVIATRRVPPWHIAGRRDAASVLEVPAAQRVA